MRMHAEASTRKGAGRQVEFRGERGSVAGWSREAKGGRSPGGVGRRKGAGHRMEARKDAGRRGAWAWTRREVVGPGVGARKARMWVSMKARRDGGRGSRRRHGKCRAGLEQKRVRVGHAGCTGLEEGEERLRSWTGARERRPCRKGREDARRTKGSGEGKLRSLEGARRWGDAPRARSGNVCQARPSCRRERRADGARRRRQDGEESDGKGTLGERRSALGNRLEVRGSAEKEEFRGPKGGRSKCDRKEREERTVRGKGLRDRGGSSRRQPETGKGVSRRRRRAFWATAMRASFPAV